MAVLGELTRNRAVLTKGGRAVPVFDHDYPYLGVGKAIPHGIYDVKLNEGYLSLGNSHEGGGVCRGQFTVVVGNGREI